MLSAIIFSLALGVATAQPRAGKGPELLPRADVQAAFIDVAVATLWTDPTKPRPIDEPALTNPVEIQTWLDSMNVSQFRNLTDNSRTQTQALYGAPVDILNYQDGWYEVAVPGQPTPKNTLGYPGWIPANQVSLDASYGKLQSTKPFATVNKVPTAALYRDARLELKYVELSYDTRLPVLSQTGGVVQVALPSGGSAYLSTSDVTVYDSDKAIPYPTKEDLVNTAKMFLDRPYLWGGMSGFAFDCSGFTHTIYHAHGITIPRDSDAQADFTGHGTSVSKEDLQPADLIFYASNQSDPSTIYHVAMYVGNGKMAEAYDAGTPVRITPVRLEEDYWGAERFLKE